MFFKKILTKLYLLILLTLTGCSQNLDFTFNEKGSFIPKTDPIWQAHLSKLKSIKKYHITGQLGYLTEKKRASTAFDWDYKNKTEYNLNLSSTLNLVTMSLAMTPQGLFLTNDGKSYYIESLEQFLLDQFGFDIPLEQLTTWLKGQPLSGQHYLVGKDHLLAEFNYLINNVNWRVRYLTYTKTDLPMPQTLQLENGKQTIKIRIENWIL